jgi:pyrimidine deaminase RibD-like protein
LNQNISIKYDGFVRLRKAGIEFDIEIIGEEMLKEFKRN